MIRTGRQYLSTRNDGRELYINGEMVSDPVNHSAFKNAFKSAANFYDFQSENTELMTYQTADTHQVANKIWQLPGSYDQLVERRHALEAWAQLHAGYLGRSPDHVASCLSGMVMGIDVFRQYSPERASALMEYYRYARDNDLYLTYVIINPQADRSKPNHAQKSEELTLSVVESNSQGITVRGAKMLATGGVLADEVLVTCIQPLQAGDERYACSFAIPMNAPGLKILSRKSYEQNAPSRFDNPLASRFDENDAVLYFEDVHVPWDRVFVDQDIAMCQKQFHATPAHVYQNYQAQIRLSVKLRFMAGLASRIAEVNGINAFPSVREALGQLSAETTMVESMVRAMEVKGQMYGDYFVPDRHTLYASQVLTQQLYPKIITTLRELSGGGMIMLPSSVNDFKNEEVARLIAKTQQSSICDSEERVKLFKMAWDAVGSEFASRHTQYEMFYSGANFVNKNHAFRTFDWSRSSDLLNSMLNSYSLKDELMKP